MRLVKTTIDCFNSRDGMGRFSGMNRYNHLEAMLPIVATQAGGNMSRFWGLLLKKMMWPVPPKRMDEEILPLLRSESPHEVLKAITEQPGSVVMLARFWHTQDKDANRVTDEEWQQVIASKTEEATA